MAGVATAIRLSGTLLALTIAADIIPRSAHAVDCYEPATAPEFYICTDPVLAALDEAITETPALVEILPLPGASIPPERLHPAAAEHMEWLSQLESTCVPGGRPWTDFEIRFKVVPCLIERYRDRISALGGSQPPVKPLPRLSAGAVHPACLTELFDAYRADGLARTMDLALCRQGTAHLDYYGYSRFNRGGGYPSRVSPVTLGVLANDRVLLLIREWGLGNATFTYLATVAGWPSGARDSAGKGQLAMTSVREFGFGCFGGVKGGRVTGPTTYTYLLNFTPAGLLDHSDYKMSHAPYENYAIYTRGCLGFVSITHDTVTEQDRVVGYAIDGLPDLGYEEDVFHQQPCFNRTMQRFADTFPTELSPETLNAFAERFIFDCAGS